MPITSENNPRNFITKITNYEKICSIKKFNDSSSDFYPIILDFNDERINFTLNLTNPGLISHNQIMKSY